MEANISNANVHELWRRIKEKRQNEQKARENELFREHEAREKQVRAKECERGAKRKEGKPREEEQGNNNDRDLKNFRLEEDGLCTGPEPMEIYMTSTFQTVEFPSYDVTIFGRACF